MNCKNFFSTAYKVVMATGVVVELVKIVICFKNGGKFGTTNGAVAGTTTAAENGGVESAE